MGGTAGSVILTILITYESLNAAEAAATAISTALGDSVDSASAALGVEVLSPPTTGAQIVLVEVSRSELGGNAPLGGIIGGATGGCIAIIACLVWYRKRRRSKALTKVATVEKEEMDLSSTYGSGMNEAQRRKAGADDDAAGGRIVAARAVHTP